MSSQDAGFPPGISAGGLGNRVLAYVLDGLPVGLASGLASVGVFTQRADLTLVFGILGSLLALAWGVFCWWRLATQGSTMGMRIAKTELVGVENGQPVGWGRTILRSFLFGLVSGTGIGLVVMLIMMLMHPRRQGWHDLAVRAVVIRARAEEEPELAQPDPSLRQSNGTVGLPASLGGSASPDPTPAAPMGLPPIPGFGSATSAAPAASTAPTAPAANPFAGQQAAGFAPTAPQGFGAGQSFPQPEQNFSPPQNFQPTQGFQQPAQGFQQQGFQQPTQGSQPVQGFPPQAPTAQPGAFAPGAPSAGNPFVSGIQQPVAAPGAPAAPAAPAQFDDSEVGVESTRLVQRTPGQQRRPDQGWTIVLGDGRQVAVESLVLIGRNPQPRDGEQGAELVSVGDNSRTVSKTHIAIGVDARGAWVMDRGSTNGSALATSTGAFEPCAAGEKVRVREGQVVSFGEQRFEVRRTFTTG